MDLTTLQLPDSTKSFALYIDASSYAIGAVLEQDGKPIGFLSQVMNRARQRYSIYDQELLALVTALDKWSRLLHVSKVTACTDHQALTHFQRLQASTPLSGRTARWLDFLTDFPDLHITYVQGTRNQVDDALSRRPGLPHTCSHDTPQTPLMLAVEQARAAPRSRGRPDSILVMVDCLTKMAHFVPAKKSFTAADTVELLADRLISYHGFPEVLISDRDPRFQSDLWQQLCSRFNIKRYISSSYQLQSDGQTERINRTLEQMLRTYIQSEKREWERLLPALELAYNRTSHLSPELSPLEVMIGENPLTAVNLDIVGALAPTLTSPMTKLSRQLCDRAQSHILMAKWQQKYYADTKRRAV
ncbi:hypothetical protein ENH_00011310 [Eimeria necatrix]|uniref:Integrase catalytic domain-containing protein n=1 Tax=Eimeria necatrix TaxID=51315 RepID=U6MNQ1_9EIME|nr:hypothetical protein ENH_00011310 [Eimeria necatrix]CDJ65857.1 hypothetical protein ENH_00011310 [Eimeria necatrix]